MLAYSTVSQLGFMFIAMGVGAYAAGVFHLMTHAFFKACLFLGSGSVIHAMHHEQDMRKMGGLKQLDADHLLDVPDLDAGDRRHPARSPGFFSKDEILWEAFCRRPSRSCGRSARRAARCSPPSTCSAWSS